MMRVEAEDNAHVLIDWGESVFAVVSTGFTMQKYRGPALEVYGSQGTIQMMGDDWDPSGYELWRNDVGAWQIYDKIDRLWHWTDGLRHLDRLYPQRQDPSCPRRSTHFMFLKSCSRRRNRAATGRKK